MGSTRAMLHHNRDHQHTERQRLTVPYSIDPNALRYHSLVYNVLESKDGLMSSAEKTRHPRGGYRHEKGSPEPQKNAYFTKKLEKPNGLAH